MDIFSCLAVKQPQRLISLIDKLKQNHKSELEWAIQQKVKNDYKLGTVLLKKNPGQFSSLISSLDEEQIRELFDGKFEVKTESGTYYYCQLEVLLNFHPQTIESIFNALMERIQTPKIKVELLA